MIPPAATSKFVDAQKRLLVATYNEAWKGGVASYQPVEPMHEADRDPAARAGAAAFALKAVREYVAPTSPDPLRRAVVVAPAFTGLDAMAAELLALAPDAAAAGAGAATGGGTLVGSLEDWATRNAARLDGGDSVAWAGEQAGYAEAADSDGQLLEWQDEGDEAVCEDCISLGGMPPMALADWPCSPGDGATDCSCGCRCSFEASEVQTAPGDDYAPYLTDNQQATLDALIDSQQAALARTLADAQYLDVARA